MIFAIIAEEFGLVGAVALIGVYCFLFSRGFRIAMRCPGYLRQPAGGRHHNAACPADLYQYRRGNRFHAHNGRDAALYQRRDSVPLLYACAP